MMTRRHLTARGYTLIEVMVAVALLGLVVTAVYSSWMAVVRASRVGLQAAAEAQRSRIAMRVMETALASARMFEANGSYYGFETENGGNATLSFIARLPESFLRSGKFGDFDVRRVTFSVESGGDFGKRLVMRQSPLLMEVDEDEKNFPLPLADNVRELRLEFWDTRKRDWVDEWKQTNQLPKMVKISLQLDQGSSYPKPIIRIVGLPSAGVPQVWQVPVPQPGPGGPGGGQPGPGGVIRPGGVPGPGGG